MNLLNEASDSKFVTRKWNIINDQSNANDNAENETIYNTEVLKSNLCDYNDAYVLVEGNITIVGDDGPEVAIKNCAPFIKIDGTRMDDVDDLDLVMLMYNLLEYGSNYSDKTGSLWFYSKDAATNFNGHIRDNIAFKSFVYKTKSVGETEA